MEIIKSDYLIIGTGLAGLYSAIKASEYGTVSLLCKSILKESNSFLAQGGIAAAVMPGDSTDYHFQDTIKTGRGLCSEKAVRILVDEGKERIEELLKIGMPFDTDDEKLIAGLEGGHSKRRVLHAGGDSTGREIINFLSKKVHALPRIKLYENIFVFELDVEENRCYGAYTFDTGKKITMAFQSGCTIMASGGIAGIYEKTTNPRTSTGDGIFLAYEKGAEIANLEMVQFHPTCFFSKLGAPFLISEAVRGEGAYLLNEENERFMPEIDPMAELAPRDVVAAAIYKEMKKFGAEHVYLNLSHLKPAYIKKRFSNIYAELAKNGLDLTKDNIPVTPAAHYTIGGIKTDFSGKTNISGLYAVGEAASTGVHGANRLASNSLLECLVFGKRAIESSREHDLNLGARMPVERTFFKDDNSSDSGYEIGLYTKKLMQKYAGLVKRGKEISELIKVLTNLETINKNEYHSKCVQMLKTVGLLTASPALERKETRGVHIRSDFPNEAPEMKIEIVQQIKSGIYCKKIE